MFNIAEKFISINGEGTKAGQPAVFIRFTGCNLRCSYCDTMWVNESDAPFTPMTADEIYNYIKQSGITNVTITGGEPLIQPDIISLLEKLGADETLDVEIETNGSADISMFENFRGKRPSLTLDYKLPSSGMEAHMKLDNYKYLMPQDTVKFVAGSKEDLDKTRSIIKSYELVSRCHIYISPVFGNIEPAEIAEYITEHKLNGVNMQLQLHKLIWPPDMKGV